jgi:hypothetical protein
MVLDVVECGFEVVGLEAQVVGAAVLFGEERLDGRVVAEWGDEFDLGAVFGGCGEEVDGDALGGIVEGASDDAIAEEAGEGFGGGVERGDGDTDVQEAEGEAGGWVGGQRVLLGWELSVISFQ